uniref:Cysteine rich secreted protein n=1 Tax=Riptortus pedestris TaxID=329032 RepID=R4WQ74_RIPPE|nr:cysteine rich secreted protein [Riptortus pedestris]
MNKVLVLVLVFCVVSAVLARPQEPDARVGGDWERCKVMRRCRDRIPCCESVEGPNCCEKPDPWRLKFEVLEGKISEGQI